MKLNFVLIDFENVQPLHLEKLQGLQVEIRVFLGSNQSRLPLELVSCLQPFGKAAQYIQLSGNGKNALDFHIAFYLGQLAAEHHGAFFHVISKDSGFDPLIAHLKTLKIYCQRWETIEQIPVVKVAVLSPASRLAAARSLLANPKTPKPSTLAKLRSVLHFHFKSVLSEPDLEAVVGGLKAAKVFTEDEGGKLSYPSG